MTENAVASPRACPVGPNVADSEIYSMTLWSVDRQSLGCLSDPSSIGGCASLDAAPQVAFSPTSAAARHRRLDPCGKTMQNQYEPMK
jgi:hypothetical protein